MPDSCTRAVWRVSALATPAWRRPCPGCCDPNARFTATDRFRVNASGARLDVWLLYACDACGATRKRSVLRRTPVAAIPPERLDAYHHNDCTRAWVHAFEIATDEPLPHRVERPALPAGGTLLACIEQPFACGLRWDRLLAAEFGWSRARVAAAWRAGAVAIDAARALSDRVVDGATFRVTLP